MIYLLTFLYTHQDEKIIVFVSNCELANLIVNVINNFDWNQVGRRVEDEAEGEGEKKVDAKILFDRNICKLHGEMEHEKRKKNFFAFDKSGSDKGAVLVCTDVASRGLDFKEVKWIIQYDLSSNIKEYVNRIGRTARIASQGSALSFVMPSELDYVTHLAKKFKIVMAEKNRYRIQKDFEEAFNKNNTNLKYKFRKLVTIEDKDEQQESLHAIR